MSLVMSPKNHNFQLNTTFVLVAGTGIDSLFILIWKTKRAEHVPYKNTHFCSFYSNRLSQRLERDLQTIKYNQTH